MCAGVECGGCGDRQGAMGSAVQCAILLLLLVAGCDAAKVTDPFPDGAIQGTGETVGYGELKEEWRGEVIQLAWEPRAYLLRGFLEDEECEHLKKLVGAMGTGFCLHRLLVATRRCNGGKEPWSSSSV